MFSNFAKKITDKDYLIFCQCFFDFISEGEKNCKIQITNYDLKGNSQEESFDDRIINDYGFFVYGSYMVVWLAQIFNDVITRKDYDFMERMDIIFNSLFELDNNVERKDNLSDTLALFNQDIKKIVIEKHSTVQFKIHKVTKGSLIRATNTPITRDNECQLYLFIILFDFFCKKYVNGYILLGTGCNMLMNKLKDSNFSTSKPYQITAYEITNAMLMGMMESFKENKHFTVTELVEFIKKYEK